MLNNFYVQGLDFYIQGLNHRVLPPSRVDGGPAPRARLYHFVKVLLFIHYCLSKEYFIHIEKAELI
jgi:hypothetical protein